MLGSGVTFRKERTVWIMAIASSFSNGIKFHPSAQDYLPFEGLALGFFFSRSGIFTCANPKTASSKLRGCKDTGAPALPCGFGICFLGTKR
jgi:hypothetical protein